MIRVLCHSPRCKLDPETGLLIPREAAPGLNLCSICLRILGEDALMAAVRHNDLGLALTASGGTGEKVGRSAERTTTLNDAAVEARTAIRHTLVAMTTMIAEKRGFTLPADTVPAMAIYVARYRDWLAAHDAAGDHAAELRELTEGHAKRIAYGARSSRFPLKVGRDEYAPCTEHVVVDEDTQATEPCPGTLWTILRGAESLVACNFDTGHTWPQTAWFKLGAKLDRQRTGRIAA